MAQRQMAPQPHAQAPVSCAPPPMQAPVGCAPPLMHAQRHPHQFYASYPEAEILQLPPPPVQLPPPPMPAGSKRPSVAAFGEGSEMDELLRTCSSDASSGASAGRHTVHDGQAYATYARQREEEQAGAPAPRSSSSHDLSVYDGQCFASYARQREQQQQAGAAPAAERRAHDLPRSSSSHDLSAVATASRRAVAGAPMGLMGLTVGPPHALAGGLISRTSYNTMRCSLRCPSVDS